MDFIYQFIEIFIITKADENSDKGNRKGTLFWLTLFAVIVALSVVLLWLHDCLK